VQIYKNDILDVDPAADADARVVEVRIRLDEPDLVAGLSNLQVDVEIRLADAAIVEEEMIVPGGSK
jgi:HlyD family secretion protein